MTKKAKLNYLMQNLKSASFTPGPLEVSKLGHTTYVNCEIASRHNIISENITCGMDSDPYVATAKAIVEAVERQAVGYGRKKGYRSCQGKRSDGFAAFPVFQDGKSHALQVARNKSYL